MLLRYLSAMLLVGALAFSGAPAFAAIVTLDGVANAGWSTDDLTRTHLYIANPNYDPGDVSKGPQYYFQWTYGTGSLPWSDRTAMVNALLAGQYVGQGNWKIESGGDVFNNPGNQIWKSVHLAAGEYTLRLTSDSRAYDLKDYSWPNEGSAHTWNAYVQIYAAYTDSTGQSFSFGGYGGYTKPTESDALQLYRATVDGMNITLAQAADLFFYINDYNSVDNAGGVSLEICSVPLPGSIFLLAPGLAWLLAGGRRRRKQS